MTAVTEFDKLWQQVEALPHPGPAPEPAIAPTIPSDRVRLFRRLLDIRTIAIAFLWSGLALLVIVNVVARGSIVAWGIGVITLCALVYVLIVPTDTSDYQAHAAAAKADWDQDQAEWESEAGPRSFEVKKLLMLEIRNANMDLPLLQDSKIQALIADKRALQLKAYLANYKVEDTKIANVAAVRSGSLSKAGVATAADINDETLHKIPGVGSSIAMELINWRNGLEANFQFDPNKPLDPASIDAVVQDIAAEANELVITLEQDLAELKRILHRIEKVRTLGKSILDAKYHAYRQAEAQVSYLTG
jgi:DNA-binding helix-hairpin-helix protein with protein kinase domain